MLCSRTKENTALKKIRTYGDAALQVKALPIAVIDEKIRNLASDLIETMLKSDGVGLAATQVGKKLRVVALNVPAPKRSQTQSALSPGEITLLPLMPIVLVNPEILAFSPFEASKEEGCLSVPGIYAPVSRPVSVKLKASLPDGTPVSCDCGGLLARAIQHEIDHLDGILFVQRLGMESLAKIQDRLKALSEKKEKS